MPPRTAIASTLLLLPLLTACASAPAPQAPPPSGETQSTALRWVTESAEHRAIYLQTYRLAGRRAESLAADRDDGTWAVVLDADETVISNAPYEEMLQDRGVTHSDARWAEWVSRRAATALPGAIPFLERVHELGGRVAIVTNRDEALCPDTEANLEAIGMPFDVLLCKPPGESEKEPRWGSIEDGTAAPDLPPLEIVMWVGDNIHDFPGLGQDLRSAAPEAFGEFGERYVILPNPMYGSWQ